MVITSFIPKFYFQDDINDKGWGCGWRCIQMMLTQFGVEKNLFEIAKEVKDIVGESFKIDIESQKIDMADTLWILLYMANVCHTMDLKVDFNMFTLESMDDLHHLYDLIEEHFITDQTPIVCTAGGATVLISGIRQNDSLFEVYIVDPHIETPEQNIKELKGFAQGGQGWINIKNIILKGKEEIGILDDNEFLMNSSCIFGFLNIQ